LPREFPSRYDPIGDAIPNRSFLVIRIAGSFTGCDLYLADFNLDGDLYGRDTQGFATQLLGT
jgi:hypothetical protein